MSHIWDMLSIAVQKPKKCRDDSKGGEGWWILLHGSIQVHQLSDLPINLSLMVIIGEGVMNLSRTELGKLAQNFFNRPSPSVVLYDGTDGEPTPFNDGASSLHIRALFNVKMLSDCGHRLLSH